MVFLLESNKLSITHRERKIKSKYHILQINPKSSQSAECTAMDRQPGCAGAVRKGKRQSELVGLAFGATLLELQNL